MMTNVIRPATLRHYRQRRRLSQQQLADLTPLNERVSLSTIKRIELASADYRANARVVRVLAAALKVEPDKLGIEPEEGDATNDPHYVDLKASIERDVDLSYQVVEHIYGIPRKAQIRMAPLFTALIAEQSLQWRREELQKMRAASDTLWECGTGRTSPKLAALIADSHLDVEKQSIDAKDVPGRMIFYDKSLDGTETPLFDQYIEELGYISPLLKFLRKFCSDIDNKIIDIDEFQDWYFDEGVSNYSVGEGVLGTITCGDQWAERAIFDGHVAIADIPEHLLGDEKRTERLAFLFSQIPDNAKLEYVRNEHSRFYPDEEIDDDKIRRWVEHEAREYAELRKGEA